jgi:hypothetical protein
MLKIYKAYHSVITQVQAVRRNSIYRYEQKKAGITASEKYA